MVTIPFYALVILVVVVLAFPLASMTGTTTRVGTSTYANTRGIRPLPHVGITCRPVVSHMANITSPFFQWVVSHPRYRQIGDCTMVIYVVVMYYKDKLTFVFEYKRVYVW